MNKKKYQNHLIRKKWSQIFLKDPHVINNIVNIFNPKNHQTIIEIGPGLGALTQPILNIVDVLTVIECDPNLIKKLLQKFNNTQLRVIHQDVMKINFNDFIHQPKQKLRLIGNLPYNIATNLLIHLLKYTHIIYDMMFMLQKEVGERIIAKPNNKKYGRLSIITQYHYKILPILKVSKYAFIPTPKVESMMIKLIPYDIYNRPYPIINITLLSLITFLAFRQRRKTIQNNLSPYLNIKKIVQKGIDVNLRAENLTIQQFCILTQILHNQNK